MDYIILDLEWNQAADSRDERSRMLTFEIIEIGAVKMNSRMEITDSFHELIRPQVYGEMHKITEQLIHLKMDELAGCRTFEAVASDFLKWCKKDFLFCTWGPLDLTELQKNMKFFGMEPLADGPLRYYDVQKLFSLAFEDGKSRRSLEHAVDFLQISKEIPFHRALADACYTARVFERIKDPGVLQRVSFDTFCLPANRKAEVHVVFDRYAKYISRAFEDKEALLADREVISTRCYLCHRNLRRKIRWFTPNGKHYYSVSFCAKHGYMKGKIRIKKTDDEKVYAVKTTKFIPEEEVEDIRQRKDRARQLRRERRSRERQEEKKNSRRENG